MDNEKTSRQRIEAGISTSTKLLVIDRVTPQFGERSLQCGTVEPPTDYYLIIFCTKRDTKLVNDTQQSTVFVV